MKAQQAAWSELILAKYPAIRGRFGFVDGKNYTVQEPSNADLQNACYNGWLHSVLITGILVFGVDGCIMYGKHNCCGSWNDSDMARDLIDMLLDDNRVADGHGIVSDTAFPVSQGLHNRIISPLKDGDLLRAHPDTIPALLSRSSAITSLRQACEWGMGSVEKVFRILHRRLPYDKDVRKARLNNLFRLWNFRVRTTGISQIKNVFNA